MREGKIDRRVIEWERAKELSPMLSASLNGKLQLQISLVKLMNQQRNLVVKIENQTANLLPRRRRRSNRVAPHTKSQLQVQVGVEVGVEVGVCAACGMSQVPCLCLKVLRMPSAASTHRCLSIDIEMQLSICQVGKWT